MEDIWSERKEFVEKRKNAPESERDAARIIHSAAFRRLQNKMQVLFVGDSDYHRTRLTHSLEVMQIARGIVYFLQESENQFKDILPDIHLIEAISYAHDLGHPPFGHAGENLLNRLMADYGGFEGNAQTFRLLTTGKEHSKNNGFNLMRRTLLGTIKYPVLYSNVLNKSCNKPPKCLYDSSKEMLDWVLEPFSDDEKKLFLDYKTQENGHGYSIHKSLDASIMNMADDIAYACHDLEDALKLGILKEYDLNQFLCNDNFMDFMEQKLKKGKEEINDFKSWFIDTIFRKEDYKKAFSVLISFFIEGCIIKEVDNTHTFQADLLKYNVLFKEDMYEKILDTLKVDISYNKVITHYKIKQLEHKGIIMMEQVFNTFTENPKLMPTEEYNIYQKANNDNDKNRILCDYVAGMTDHFLTKVYTRLFIPNAGSISDIV